MAKKHKLIIKDKELRKLFLSDFAVTDNQRMALFGPEIVEKYINEKNIKEFETFLLTEEILDIKINRNKELTPVEKGEMVVFESIGQFDKELINWLRLNFPNCVFYPIQEWFGKKVNTLVCVLANPHGKPVGVVKTT